MFVHAKKIKAIELINTPFTFTNRVADRSNVATRLFRYYMYYTILVLYYASFLRAVRTRSSFIVFYGQGSILLFIPTLFRVVLHSSSNLLRIIV